MNDIDILKKAIAKKHPCDDCHAALNRLEALLNEATIFFAPDADFDGKKTDWLIRAGLLTNKAANGADEGRAKRVPSGRLLAIFKLSKT